jgi:tetratricopeptide (TPR) repeat protein
MDRFLTILIAVLLCVGFVAFVTWLLWRWLNRSQDAPAVLIGKWMISLFLLALAFGGFFVLGPFAPFLVVFCAIALSVMWTPNIGGKLAALMSGGLDGGNTPPERKPVYSLAMGLRKRGRYAECVAELRQQLAAFPDDYEGATLLAEVLAENLGDFFSAQVVLERIANNSSRPAHQRAYALTQLADWQLKFNRDPDAARIALQNIVDWLPGTEQARKAAQRLAHLDVNHVPTSGESQPVKLRHVEDDSVIPAAKSSHAPDVTEQLAALSGHLHHNPTDAETREELAKLYADALGQPELAVQTLEQGATLAADSPREVARWLNLAAEYQVQRLDDVRAAEATLQRLVLQFPGTAFAVAAEQRIARLGVEARGKRKSQGLRLGSYEKDLGLSGSNRAVTGD